jgi:plastocyanin
MNFKAAVLVFILLIMIQTAAGYIYSGTNNTTQTNATASSNATNSINTTTQPIGDTYTVYVDREFGFWAVRSDNVTTMDYTNKILDINTGDSVRWMNMDVEGDRITIISDNTLWEGGQLLSGTGKWFRFTFNSSGYYQFHIVENTRVNLNASNYTHNQSKYTSITYEDEDGEIHTIKIKRRTNDNSDYLKSVIESERYIYQKMNIKVSGLMVGNGTFPIRNATKIDASGYASGYNYNARTGISVNARPTSTVRPTGTPNITVIAPKPLESYQEFTIFEVLKRWYAIIKGEMN